jgi:hypothetical protein
MLFSIASVLLLLIGTQATDPRLTQTAQKVHVSSSDATTITSTTRFRQQLPPTIQEQTKGGENGRDISGCAPGCDFVNSYKCCGNKCVDMEMSCD